MHPDNARAVIDGLLAYAEAAQNDSSDLDGKTIRDDMRTFAGILHSDTLHTTDDVLSTMVITYAHGTYNWS